MKGLLGKLGMAPPSSGGMKAGSPIDDMGGDEESPDDAEAPDEAQSAMGDELVAAIKSGDGAAVFQAFKAMLDASKDY